MLTEIFDKKEKFKLYFNAVAVSENGEGYASAIEFNGLFHLDMATGRCRYIGMFPDEDPNKQYMHLTAQYCNGNVFFFPQRGEYIFVYNIERKSFDKINLPETTYSKYFKHIKLAQSFVYKEKVYVIGATYPAVIEIDSQSLETNFFPINVENETIMFRAGGIKLGEQALVPSLNSNIVLQFNFETKDLNLLRLKGQYRGSWSMTYDEKYFWFTPRYENDPIVRWDMEKNEVVEIEEFPKGYIGSDISYIRCFYQDKYVWMYPENANMILKINPHTMEVMEHDQIKDIKASESMGCFFIHDNIIYGKKKNREASWLEKKEAEDFRLDLISWEKTSFYFYFAEGSEEYIQDYYSTIKNRNKGCLNENESFMLKDFLSIVSATNRNNHEIDDEADIGYSIHKCIT